MTFDASPLSQKQGIQNVALISSVIRICSRWIDNLTKLLAIWWLPASRSSWMCSLWSNCCCVAAREAGRASLANRQQSRLFNQWGASPRGELPASSWLLRSTQWLVSHQRWQFWSHYRSVLEPNRNTSFREALILRWLVRRTVSRICLTNRCTIYSSFDLMFDSKLDSNAFGLKSLIFLTHWVL